MTAAALTREAIAAIPNARLHSEHNRAYQTWRSMFYRCNNKKSPSYEYYGARGISVCARWALFRNFLIDMGDPPDEMSIDRINNDLGYEPSNCRWATRPQQLANQRRTHFVTYRGETMPIRYAANLAGLDERTVHARIRRGWTENDALTIQVGGSNGR